METQTGNPSGPGPAAPGDAAAPEAMSLEEAQELLHERIRRLSQAVPDPDIPGWIARFRNQARGTLKRYTRLSRDVDRALRLYSDHCASLRENIAFMQSFMDRSFDVSDLDNAFLWENLLYLGIQLEIHSPYDEGVKLERVTLLFSKIGSLICSVQTIVADELNDSCFSEFSSEELAESHREREDLWKKSCHTVDSSLEDLEEEIRDLGDLSGKTDRSLASLETTVRMLERSRTIPPLPENVSLQSVLEAYLKASSKEKPEDAPEETPEETPEEPAPSGGGADPPA